MTKIELDGNKINENEIEYLKESFDLPVFDGDYEDIYQYLIGYFLPSFSRIWYSPGNCVFSFSASIFGSKKIFQKGQYPADNSPEEH